MPDASLCIDAFASMALGNQLQVWGCNGYPQQGFVVNWGTTIRLNQNYKLCLDVILPATNGALLQSWGCNGLANQQFIYDDATGVLQYGGDPSLNLCVDVHDVKQPGTRLMLWSCNGFPAQSFGFDAAMQTIYLRLSGSFMSPRSTGGPGPAGLPGYGLGDVPDATLCLDVTGGSFKPGTAVTTWGCNGCWNQQFILGGGVTKTATWRGDLAASVREAHAQRPETCPPVPSPSTPCAGGWPSFASAADLTASPWGAYLKEVYGAVPQGATYPWCVHTYLCMCMCKFIDNSCSHACKADFDGALHLHTPLCILCMPIGMDTGY